jgi:tetratricopeptide (TPR) repeat protein/HEAT repeat protein
VRTFPRSRSVFRRALLVILAQGLVSSTAVSFAAVPTDFNPEGRRPPRTQPRPPRTPTPRTPAGEGPTTDALIKRYMAIVMARPEEPFPLRRLAELYRSRDGNLTKLRTELEQRMAAGGNDGWSAKVALAGIYRIDNKVQDAIRLYREALQARPNAIGATRALAEVVLDSGDLVQARTLYEQVLSKTTARVDKESAMRTLIRIALDQKDYTAAKGYHGQLVRLAQGSIFVRAELGRELMQRGQYALAEAEYRDLVKAAAGDNRALAPALRDLGSVLVRQRKTAEAIDVLRRALRVAGRGAGVRREVHLLITEAYRAEGKLPELITLLEQSRSNDFQEIVTLGLLLEETGQVDKALVVYRRALRLNQRHIDTRLKVIHILQAQGELEEAIKEYESLIRAVPNNPDFTFELCEILIQRGDRAKALSLLTRLEQHTRDDDQLGRVADFYERIEEKDRAMRILQRLAASGSRDPRYVIDLGDRYFQQGDKKKALDTWARLRTIITNRAEASATLGEVYLDHDMSDEAIEALREAVKLAPKNLRYLKSLAMALERTGAARSRRRTLTGQYLEALQLWQKILELAHGAGDMGQAREARMHIVTLWALSNQLPSQVGPLVSKFEGTPPDIQAGRMLSEVQIRLRRLPDAEKTLAKLTELRPGEPDIFLSLERVYVLQRKLDKAIDILKRLTEIDPKRARQYYQRMAQYAAELYRDDDAVSFAAQAVALAPDDAEGHRKLGEMYRRRQDNERAISEFRAAIAKNDRLFLVYFDLAELLLARGKPDEADQLFRRVVRMCPDEEMVARAARLSMQLNLGKGTLEVLERELLPAALGNPQKRVYRRLLVDLYGAMTFPLVQRVRFGTDAEASTARTELTKIGTRAVKPLLDALADENQAQQLIAIEVLAFVQNRSAAPALFAFATGQADAELRSRAMVACGALRDPGLLPRYRNLLLPKAGSTAVLGGPIPVAAAWGVARIDDPKARPLLRELSKQGAPEIRALALLGLGFSKDRQAAAVLAEVARSVDAGNVARAAAAMGLAELGATNQVDPLVALAQSPDALPREASLVALSRLAPERAKPIIADALFDSSPELRKAAFAAALVVATGQFKRPEDPWAVPDSALDVRSMIARLQPSGYDAADQARTLVELEKEITRAALQAVRTSPDRAQLVADALLARGTAPSVAPFTDGLDGLPPERRAEVEKVAARVAANVAPAFVPLVRHPASDLRIRAVRVLARQTTPEAQAAVIDALLDEDEMVQRAALAVLGESGSREGVEALSKILVDSPTWSLRVRAAKALGRIQPGRAPTEAVAALTRAAKQDEFALVREAAVAALARVAAAEAKPVLTEVAGSDVEPKVRELAQRLLQGG